MATKKLVRRATGRARSLETEYRSWVKPAQVQRFAQLVPAGRQQQNPNVVIVHVATYGAYEDPISSY